MKLGLATLRITLGGLFFGHGAQKLFGWFGGYGPEGTGQFFESLGLKPGRRHATAAGAAEAGGGALLALGLFTPAAAGAIIGTMATAIRHVHAKNGPWVTQNGWEYNAVIIAAMVALADLGPGDLSLDAAFGTEVKGPLIALLTLAGGIAGATVLTRQSSGEPAGDAGIPGDPAAAGTGSGDTGSVGASTPA